MSAVQVIAGFSLTNRWLLYASFMLFPAQFIAGIGSNLPTNLGFLAYNWYTQIAWYQAIKAHQLHALSLLPVHFNMIYVFTYLGGISSGNKVMGLLLGFGTAGVIVLNTVAAWIAWATNQPDGFGVYQFYFFGWRTLSPGWHTFILLWQISDSLLAATGVIMAIAGSIAVTEVEDDDKLPASSAWRHRLMRSKGFQKFLAIPVGAAGTLLLGWIVILWTELIVARNNIESATDWIAVWLFIAQAASLVISIFVDGLWDRAKE